MKQSDAEVRRSMDALEAEYWTVVGLCVKLRREAAGWSQAELARRSAFRCWNSWRRRTGWNGNAAPPAEAVRS